MTKLAYLLVMFNIRSLVLKRKTVGFGLLQFETMLHTKEFNHQLHCERYIDITYTVHKFIVHFQT